MSGRPRRRHGQHFLEPAWATRVVGIIDPRPGETILEIGPGRGALTEALVASGAQVVAVEIDPRLARELAGRVPAELTVVTGDFLDLSFECLGLGERRVRVVGNLPYDVGTGILVKIVRHVREVGGLSDAVLMFQREVADRVTARPGTRDWGPLAVLTRVHADSARRLTLPPGAFRPMPQVRSAVVTLAFRPAPVEIVDHELFQRMVRAIFTQRRKTVLNAARPFVTRVSRLPAEAAIAQAGLDPRSRPAELGLAELAELAEVLRSSRR